MAFDEYLAERIQRELDRRKIDFFEKKMFGGWCAMVDDKMCIGVVRKDLMVRVNPADAEHLQKKTGARPMDFTGNPMKGFLFVDGDGYDLDEDLAFWIDQALAFNPLARSNKKTTAKKN